MQKHQGMSSSQSKREQRSKKTEMTEKAVSPSIQRESTHICVLEIKTVCLSLDSIATRSGAVMTITILGILFFTWHFFDEECRKIHYPFRNDIQFVLCHFAREESGSQITKQTYSTTSKDKICMMPEQTGCRDSINRLNTVKTRHRVPPSLILSNYDEEKEIR